MEELFKICNLTREDILQIYQQGPEAVVLKMLELAKIIKETAQERDALRSQVDTPTKSIHPSTPSGAIPVYEKENSPGRGRKKPGRKRGHKGECREKPARFDKTEEPPLTHCPHCGDELSETTATRERYIEDIPVSTPVVTRYIIHRSFCKHCNKLVEPVVTAALPKSNIGLNLLALSAWFHYGLGTTISHIAIM